jgi:hypothetical protein
MGIRCLTAHPASVGETYFGHLRFALWFGASMVSGGLACMVHGLLPFCLTTAGSRRVRVLHAVLERHPARRAMPRTADDTALGDAQFNWSI